MMTPSRQFRSLGFRPGLQRGHQGFTLVEIVIALAVLGVMAAGCYIGFNAINAYAVSSRLYSEAQTAAQNQIDLILSKEPFDVNGAYISGTFNPALNKVPAEVMTVAEIDALATSGVAFPTSPPSSPPATTSAYYPYYPYYRSGAGQPLSKQAFIYQDPVSGQVVVTGTLVTTVSDTTTTMAFAGVTTNLNVRKATTTVNYSFRNKDYVIAMDTLRTADQ
jgi:prepilin-type N-terminal cleavage/methylation domain-containing protein